MLLVGGLGANKIFIALLSARRLCRKREKDRITAVFFRNICGGCFAGNRPTLAQHMAEGMRLKRIPASKIMGCPFSADNCDSECSECVEQSAILFAIIP